MSPSRVKPFPLSYDANFTVAASGHIRRNATSVSSLLVAYKSYNNGKYTG